MGEVTQSVNQLIKRQDSFISKIERMDKVLGSIGSRWSSLYESLITDFLREFLEKEGLDYNCVNKFSFKDDKGIYGFKGRKYEIDILAKEDKVYMIEVKYSAEDKDVEWFDIRCKVIREVLGLTKQPVKLFLAITAKKDAVDRANELGIKMIAEDIFEIPKKK
ncbi:DUF3782 domain-containing protein [Sulfolobus tengchongensis]|uniref:DUF3782 domain-containing protein n=1 Tax=Sulfolobus tengchongensis TaxID=207809 RepID=A0AAX4L346_9CREN